MFSCFTLCEMLKSKKLTPMFGQDIPKRLGSTEKKVLAVGHVTSTTLNQSAMAK